MLWIILIWVWFLYPIAATGLIIGLWITNRRYKKKIEELLYSGSNKTEPVWMQHPDQEMNRTQINMVSPIPVPDQEVRQQKQLILQSNPEVSKPPKISSSYPGTVALIIGVVFVVLAGLIFATTTWRLLPDMFKVVMVFAFALFFFADSLIAGKWLKIERTGRAFYILGSIFLFLTVLAAGYFKVLGPAFILEGRNRYWVLWVGSVVTECAFLIGFRSYQEKIYSYLYLIGLTVSVSFLTAALRSRFTGGMVCYSFLILMCGWMNERQITNKGKGFLPETAAEIWNGFSLVQFVIFVILLMPGVFLGFAAELSGAWMAGHRITIWDVFCLVIAVAGMRLAMEIKLEPDREPAGIFAVLYCILLPVLFQYAAWGIPGEMEYRCLFAAVIVSVWFLIDWKKWNPFRVEREEVAVTAALVMNTVFLSAMALADIEHEKSQLAATGAILMLCLITMQWSRRYPAVRRTFPYLLSAVAVMASRICGSYGITGIRYDWILFACFAITIIWDIRKKDCFRDDILLLGTVFQLGSWRPGREFPPFFLLLFLYLFLKSADRQEKERLWMRKAGSFYLTVGIYFLLSFRFSNRILEVLTVLGVLILQYELAAKWDRSRDETVFWAWMGSGTFLLLIWQYYLNETAGAGYLIICMAVFLVLYGSIYLGNSRFAGLPMAFSVLLLPWYMRTVGGFTENQVYLWTAVVLLFAGICLRRFGPVYEMSEDGKEILKIDWLSLLLAAVVIPMIWLGSREWRFVYTLLLIPYVLQFYGFLKLRRAVLTAVMAVVVLAWWLQPFGIVPDRIWLEMFLLPVALFSAGLPFIWGKGETVRNVQTGIYGFCLILLAGEALISGDVWDAISLEAICLIIFVASYLVKCRRWVIIAGTMIVLVVLYMTKGFWLSLSWWVYLLAAGGGMIGFAAWYEKRNKGSK